MSDLEMARAPLIWMSGFDEYAAFVIPGEPKPKARPRLSGRRVHSDPKQVANQKVLALHFRKHVRSPIRGSVAISAVFIRKNYQRVDVDNMLKQLLDAANKIAFDDDSQITLVVGAVRVDASAPRTVVCIGRDVGGPRDPREKGVA